MKTHLARIVGPDASSRTWCGLELARQQVTTRISLVDCAACKSAFASMLHALPDVVPTPLLRGSRMQWEDMD
jgi:hypothetical protein